MKQKIKDISIITLGIMLIIILYYASIYGVGMLFAYIFTHIETTTYEEIEFSLNKIIDNEDKEKLISILKLKDVPVSLNIVEVRYIHISLSNDEYDIIFEIDCNDTEEFEKNNNERASNVFEINKTIENDKCIYEYRCGVFDVDENYKTILEMIAKYD